MKKKACSDVPDPVARNAYGLYYDWMSGPSKPALELIALPIVVDEVMLEPRHHQHHANK